MSQKFEVQRCQWHKFKLIKFHFADKGNSETMFEHFFITLSSSHFLNKIDLKQYLLKP